ncbi:MAG TPA: tripartite tricarboxylate transporter substrate binding protein, partial [Burkholderiales bacterium]|nr:tripartite tricarboxylate transporter substrate binding protein [Burkholderiales bacterium]
MKSSRAVTAAMLMLVATSASAAQSSTATDYPNRPIRMIAPSSTGGPVDVIARAVSQGLGEVLGQQVVVDNR